MRAEEGGCHEGGRWGLQQESRGPRAGWGRMKAREDLRPQHSPHMAFHPLGFTF